MVIAVEHYYSFLGVAVVDKSYTGTGTMFGAYPCSAPTIFKYKMNIYWPIENNKWTNKEHG